MTEPVNLYDVALEPIRPTRRATAPGGAFGPASAPSSSAASVYELDPGESVCPYHYEGVEEEWLLVLTGRRPCATPTASTSSRRATSSASRRARAAPTR